MEELRSLFAYNRWAALRLLDAIEGLSDEEFNRDLGSSFPSVAATLVHIMGAEWVWLQRWLGTSPTSFPDATAMTSVAAVRARWTQLWAEQQAWLDTIDEGALQGVLSYRAFDGQPFAQPLGRLALHVINHSTYHRGQVATMLRQLGRTPPSTDLVRFYREAWVE